MAVICTPFLLALEQSGAYWHEAVLFLAISGGFGGILGVLQHVNLAGLVVQNERPGCTSSSMRWALTVGALGGIGGALSFLTVLVIDGKLDGPLDDKARLILCSTGVVAGFVGYQLLTTFSERAIAAAKAAGGAAGAEAAKEIAEEGVRIVAGKTRELDYENTLVNAYLLANQEQADKSLIEPCICDLIDLLKRDPTARRPAILLGRLYRNQFQLDQAISILTQTIDARRNTGFQDEDTAAIIYNRACYKAILAQQRESASLKEDALNDLRQSVLMKRENATMALTDPDFETLRDHPRFASILQQADGSSG